MMCKENGALRRPSILLSLALAAITLAAVGTAERTAGAEAEQPCFVEVVINPESRVEAHRGTVPARLRQGVWQSFRVCFQNDAKVTAVPRVISPNAPADKHRDRWLDVRLEPADKRLTGAVREYRILRLRSRDTGPREATFLFDVGQGTQDLGFRGQVSALFQCSPPEGGSK
jgi:hypothetical protein